MLLRNHSSALMSATATLLSEHSFTRPKYSTRWGRIYCADAEAFLLSPKARRYAGKVQLIFTSPPFPLNTKKAYGNLQGSKYTDWLAKFAPLFKQMLTPTGSIVLEMGNAWEPGQPVLFDQQGYVLFERSEDYDACHQVKQGPDPNHIHVEGGIASIPGYVKLEPPLAGLQPDQP